MLNDNQETNMLKAEISILKSNLKRLEKENESLKIEKSKTILNKMEIEEEVKKKINLQLKEEQIKENHKKVFKTNSFVSYSSEIPPKFILLRTINNSDLSPLEKLQKIQFFRNYFFDDFFTITEKNAFEIVDEYFKINNKLFVEAYSLFSCKKYVFQEFAQNIFCDNSYLPLKIEILENVPPEWTLNLLNGVLGKFIAINTKKLLYFFRNIAEKCPSSLSNILSKQDFNEILINKTPIGDRIILAIAKNKISGFLDETNIHLASPTILKIIYEDEYIDLI